MLNPITTTVADEKIIIKISGAFTEDRLGIIKKNIAETEKLIKKISEKKAEKINILLDIEAFEGSYDVQAMELMAEFAKNNKEFTKKTAVFGGSSKANIIGKVIAALAERENIRFFTSQEEAENWLAE